MYSKPPACRAARIAACAILLVAGLVAQAGEFSVSPIRAELKPGSMSETVTVMNHSDQPMRVSVRLMEWTQDDAGKDVLKESGDLVYFPRQLDIEPGGKRLVRVGAKNPAGPVERTYRLFIEETPPPAGAAQPGMQVSVYFRFGLPVFLPPAVPKLQAEFSEPQVRDGQLEIQVRNTGNLHFRLNKVEVSDGAGFSQNLGGWYTLAGAARTYAAKLPPQVCRSGRPLTLLAEGEGVRYQRALAVPAASCG